MEHDNENNNNQVIIINKREREETYLNELNNKVRENKVNNNNDNNNDNNNININNINNAETQKHSANLLTEVLEKRGGNLCIINVGSQNLRIGFASTFKTTASTSTGASSHSSENIERQQQQQQQQQQPFCFKHVCAYKKNKKTEHSIKKTSSSTTITKASDEEYVIANNATTKEQLFDALLKKEGILNNNNNRDFKSLCREITTTTMTTSKETEIEFFAANKKGEHKTKDDDEMINAAPCEWKFGEDALEVYGKDDDWEVVFPFRKGKLVASETVLENCWRNALEKAKISNTYNNDEDDDENKKNKDDENETEKEEDDVDDEEKNKKDNNNTSNINNSKSNDRDKIDVLLIVPPLCSRKDIEIMTRTLLVGLNFRSICIHSESSCAFFSLSSTNQKTTCVVDIGAQTITVECVDTLGCPIANTRVTLPYGYEHLSLCNVAANRSCGTWTERASEIGAHKWFENVLAFAHENITCDNDVRHKVDRVIRFKQNGKLYESTACSKALSFASEALFEPERIKFKGPFTDAGGFWEEDDSNNEDANEADEQFFNTNENNNEQKGFRDNADVNANVNTDGYGNSITITTSIGRFMLPSALSREGDYELQQTKRPKVVNVHVQRNRTKHLDENGRIIGLHEAIVASCLGCEIPAQKSEALKNILLVGGGAEIPEIEEVIEGRVVSTLSRVVASMIDNNALAALLHSTTPVVLDHKAGTIYANATFAGACILGCLDDSRVSKEWLTRKTFQDALKIGGAGERWCIGLGGYELNGLYRYLLLPS